MPCAMTTGMVRVACCSAGVVAPTTGEHGLGPQRDQFGLVFLQAGEIARHGTPAILDAQIASDRPTQFRLPTQEAH
jgi:hypothetical protein